MARRFLILIQCLTPQAPWRIVVFVPNHFPVAEHVSVPGQGGSEGTRGNETKTERLRVPLREENGSRCIIPPHSPRSGKCELSDIRVAMSHAY